MRRIWLRRSAPVWARVGERTGREPGPIGCAFWRCACNWNSRARSRQAFAASDATRRVSGRSVTSSATASLALAISRFSSAIKPSSIELRLIGDAPDGSGEASVAARRRRAADPPGNTSVRALHSSGRRSPEKTGRARTANAWPCIPVRARSGRAPSVARGRSPDLACSPARGARQAARQIRCPPQRRPAPGWLRGPAPSG